MYKIYTNFCLAMMDIQYPVQCKELRVGLGPVQRIVQRKKVILKKRNLTIIVPITVLQVQEPVLLVVEGVVREQIPEEPAVGLEMERAAEVAQTPEPEAALVRIQAAEPEQAEMEQAAEVVQTQAAEPEQATEAVQETALHQWDKNNKCNYYK